MLRINAIKRLRDYTLDVDIRADGTVILMGGNGSGKTTVLDMAGRHSKARFRLYRGVRRKAL